MKKIFNKYLILVIISTFMSCITEKNPEIIEDLFFEGNIIDDSLYKTYNYIQSDQHQSLLYDDVDTDSGLWPNIATGDITSEHTSDGYLINNTYEHDRFISVNIDDFENTNFEIEFVMKLENSTSSESSGFFWGDDNIAPHKFYYYKFSNNPQAIELGEWYGLFDSWYDSEDLINFSINTSSFNKFTIRKINNKYYFFINEIFLFDTFIEPFFGNNIGILNGGYSKSLFKSIKIDYLVNL